MNFSIEFAGVGFALAAFEGAGDGGSCVVIHQYHSKIYGQIDEQTFCDRDGLAQHENGLLPVRGGALRACAEACNLLLLGTDALSALEGRFAADRPELGQHRFAFLHYFDRGRGGYWLPVCSEEGVEVKDERVYFGASFHRGDEGKRRREIKLADGDLAQEEVL